MGEFDLGGRQGCQVENINKTIFDIDNLINDGIDFLQSFVPIHSRNIESSIFLRLLNNDTE